MLYYNRIDVSEGVGFKKTNASKESIICHYWYLLDKGFKLPSSVCNGCHDVLIMVIDINIIAFLNIHGVGYRCIIIGISKSEALT